MVGITGESKVLDVDPLARLEVVKLLQSGFLRIIETGTNLVFVVDVVVVGIAIGAKKPRKVEARIGNNGVTLFAWVKV